MHNNCKRVRIIASYSIPCSTNVVSSVSAIDFLDFQILPVHLAVVVRCPRDVRWWVSCGVAVKSDIVSFDKNDVWR